MLVQVEWITSGFHVFFSDVEKHALKLENQLLQAFLKANEELQMQTKPKQSWRRKFAQTKSNTLFACSRGKLNMCASCMFLQKGRTPPKGFDSTVHSSLCLLWHLTKLQKFSNLQALPKFAFWNWPQLLQKIVNSAWSKLHAVAKERYFSSHGRSNWRRKVSEFPTHWCDFLFPLFTHKW